MQREYRINKITAYNLDVFRLQSVVITDFSALTHAKIELEMVFDNKGLALASFEVYETTIQKLFGRYVVVAYELQEFVGDEEGYGITKVMAYSSIAPLEAAIAAEMRAKRQD